jgi:4-diphosphocytidyl-2-C-methyl-D-erythritol kinase
MERFLSGSEKTQDDFSPGRATIKESAPAKINLFLHVGERRADGFHPLQSLVVFTGLGDVLAMEEAAELSLAVEGPFARGLEGEGDNLVLRAAKSLLEDGALGGRGARLTLTKNLPVASGIGGGSADAAAALRGLSRLWDKNGAGLQEIAASLGSDIPVCMDSVAAFMEGRGEILRPALSMPLVPMLLINPGVAVPTKDVFAGLQTRSGVEMKLPPGRFQDTADLLRFLESTRNDLEAPALELQPVIGDVLAAIAALPGALLARMSGSGATCFGIFADQDCCERAAGMLSQAAPGWWVAPTFVPENGIVHEDIGQDIGPSDAGL